MMFIFERLRPFVWICQVFGVFPFYMETDPHTQRFIKFSFSFKNLVTWWFFFILSLQAVFLVFDVLASWQMLTQGIKSYDVPLLIVVFLAVEFMFMYIFVFVTRYVTLKCSRVGRAVLLLLKVHQEIDADNFPPDHAPKVTRFVISCIVTVTISVSNKSYVCRSNLVNNFIFKIDYYYNVFNDSSHGYSSGPQRRRV